MDKEYKLFKIAYAYYVDKLNQEQIAKMHGISRSNVSMMLNEARKMGIVEVKVRFPKLYCTDLEKELENRFNLDKVIVLQDYSENDGERISFLAGAAGEYLDTLVEDNMVIGVSWGKSVYQVASAMTFHGKTNVLVTPLVGGIGNAINQYHSNLIASNLAENIRGTAFGIYAPIFVHNEESKEVLMADRQIEEVLNMSRNADLAIVGIGNIQQSTMQELDILKENEIKKLMEEGVVGDINTSFINVQGEEAESFLKNRTIGISLDDLKKIKNVVAVVGGEVKYHPLRAILNNRVINTLIIDDRLAQLLLARE